MKNVMLLYGGRSFEHDVSVISAIQIGELWPQEYRLIPVYMRDGTMRVVRDWRRYTSYTGDIKGQKVKLEQGAIRIGARKVEIACALLATHGGEGEDGTLQSILQYHQIPYTSCDALSSALCMDKIACKIALAALGFAVVPGEEARPDVIPPLPAVCKPARLGSSIGISVARTEEQWRKAYYGALEFDKHILYEAFVENAREYNCAAVQNGEEILVSAVERPAYTGDTYTFGDKYKCECVHELPAAIPDEMYREIQDTTVAVYRALRLWGVVRVDYLYDGNTLYINEINTIPGSLSYRLFSASGVPLKRLLGILVDNARYYPYPKVEYGHLLHELIGTYK